MLRTILRELPEEDSIEQRYSGRSPSYRPVMGDPEDHGSSTTRGTLAFDSDLDVLSAMQNDDAMLVGSLESFKVRPLSIALKVLRLKLRVLSL